MHTQSSTAVATRGACFNALAQHAKRVSINVRAERITTVIAASSRFLGDLSLEEGIKLDGHLQGNLTFGVDDGLAIVSKSATLQGNLRGPRALVMGTIEGDVFIHGLLVLSPTAMILGNIYYDRVIVHDGAQISGTMHMNHERGVPAALHGEATAALESAEEGGGTLTHQGVVTPIRAAAAAGS